MKYGRWNFGEVEALLNKIGEKNAMNLLRDQVEVTFTPKDIPGLFESNDCQVTVWRELLPDLRERYGVDADLNGFLQSSDAPERPEEKCVAVVLVLRGPSAEAEIEMYWNLITRRFETRKLEAKTMTYASVKWYEGSENSAADWHFEWQVICLGSHRNVSCETVRAQAKSSLPNAGVLAAAIQHPKWAISMGDNRGCTVPSVDIAGYVHECRRSEIRPLVPHLGCSRTELRLDSAGADEDAFEMERMLDRTGGLFDGATAYPVFHE